MKNLLNDNQKATLRDLRELREELYRLQKKVLEIDIKQNPPVGQEAINEETRFDG